LNNIKSYKKFPSEKDERMRRACLSLIVSKLLSNNGSKVQLDKMMKIYKVLDKSGDGKISHNEIKSCFKTLE
jgi:Ca2+-binding EF-hand superfamily protein